MLLGAMPCMKCSVWRGDCSFCNLPSPWTPVVQGAISEWSSNFTYVIPFSEIGMVDENNIINLSVLMNSTLYALRLKRIHRGQIAVWLSVMRGGNFSPNGPITPLMEAELVQEGTCRQRGMLVADPDKNDLATSLANGNGQLFDVDTNRVFYIKFRT